MMRVNKCLHILLMLALILSAFALPVLASTDGDAVLELSSATESSELIDEGIDGLLRDFSLILPDGLSELADGGLSALGVDSLLSELVSAVKGNGTDAFSFFLLLCASAALMACAPFLGSELSVTIRSALSLLVGGVILSTLLTLASEVGEALSGMGEFFAALIPILTAAAGLAGGGSVATASGTGMTLSLSLFGGLCGGLLPLVAVMLTLGVVSAISPDMRSGLLSSVREWFMRGIGILTLVLGGLFSVQTAVATATDSAALRAIKYAASGSIPVVGGAVSGALSTLAGGVGYATGVIGGGGVAALILLALSPLVRLLLYRFAFTLASLFYDSLSVGEGERTFSSLAYGLDALIAVYALGSVVYIFETLVVMKSISALL